MRQLTDLAAGEATANKRELRAGHRNWGTTQVDPKSGAVLRHRVSATGDDPYSRVTDLVGATVIRETDYTWQHENGVYRLDGYTMTLGPKGHELIRITARFDGGSGRTDDRLAADLASNGARFAIAPPGRPSFMEMCDPMATTDCVDGCDPYMNDCTISTDGYDSSAYTSDLNAQIDQADAAISDSFMEVSADNAALAAAPDSCSERKNNLLAASAAAAVAVGALQAAVYSGNILAIGFALLGYGSAQAWQVYQRNLLWECINAWRLGHPIASLAPANGVRMSTTRSP